MLMRHRESISSITPGPPRVVIVSHTLNYGIKKSFWTAFGDISANLCQGVLVVFFIGTFLSDNPNILKALKWAGILYIIYLAYDTYTSRIKIINSGLKSNFKIKNPSIKVLGLNPHAGENGKISYLDNWQKHPKP